MSGPNFLKELRIVKPNLDFIIDNVNMLIFYLVLLFLINRDMQFSLILNIKA
jgi:hypothetical protein